MKKGTIFTVIVLMLLSMLAACSGNTNQTNASSPEGSAKNNNSSVKNEPVEIEFWYGLGGQVGDVIKNQVERFNESQDEVKVNAVFQQNYDVTGQKLQAAIVGGDVPDIVQLNTRVWPVFAYNDAFLPLDDYIENDPEFNFDDFNKGLLVNTSLNGTQYTLPYNRSTPLLYYNKDIMREIGVDPENPVETWDDLVEVAKKASIIKDGKVERFGFSASMSGWYFYSLVWSNGGEILGSDLKTVKFDEPEAAKGLEIWKDMINKDKIMMPPLGGTSTSGSSAGESLTQSFFNEQTAFTISSTGSLGKFRNSVDFDLGTTFLPKFKEYAVPTGGANLVVLKNISKERQDASWKFIKFLTSTEESIYFSKETGYLPIRKSAENSTELQNFFKENPNYTSAIKQLQYAREVKPSEHVKRIESEINKAMEKAVVEDISAEEALKEAADMIRSIMK